MVAGYGWAECRKKGEGMMGYSSLSGLQTVMTGTRVKQIRGVLQGGEQGEEGEAGEEVVERWCRFWVVLCIWYLGITGLAFRIGEVELLVVVVLT